MKAVFDFGGDQHQVLDACPQAADDGVSVGFGDPVTGENGRCLSGDAHDLGASVERLLGAGAIARFENPAQMGQRIAQDYQRWGQIIRDKGIAPE